MDTFDLIVLGGGPAGYTAALCAAKKGCTVALIEKGALGGTCLNCGCIPTKTLLETAATFERISKAASFGINLTGEAKLNREMLLEKKNAVIEGLRRGLTGMIQAAKIQVVDGTGRLAGNGKVIVDCAKPCEITGNKIIVASGSSEARLQIKGSDYMIGSTEALKLESIPADICIVGGGVIGIELATFYAGVGSKVHIIEATPSILSNVDRQIATMLQRDLERKGIQIDTGCSVTEVRKNDIGFSVVMEKGGRTLLVSAEAVLNAVGRIPNTSRSEMENCGVRLDHKGAIVVDQYLKSTVENIYAAGDVTGGMLLAHTAFYEGELAAINALEKDKRLREKKAVPQCIYTHPEIGTVGLTEEAAKAAGIKFKKGVFPLSANGRSLAAGTRQGLVKVIADDKVGQLLGVHIYGEMATEVIGAAVVAIESEYTCQAFQELILPHPTIGEALKDAVSCCL